MIQMRTIFEVADNTGAKIASAIGVVGRSGVRFGKVGDIIRANVKEASADSSIKEGTVIRAVIVRTRNPIRRPDGTVLRFDSNALVVIDAQKNPVGTRIFGPVPHELREKDFMKIMSLAPEVI